MRVPVNAPSIGREEIKAVNSVLRSGALTSPAREGGRYVREFEGLSASFVKSRFSVAVNSGTAAIQASLLALGVKTGDEVLLPSFTFVATANAVASTGARPVFVDILGDNYTMDPSDLEKKITKKSRAVIPVHLYGNVAYMGEISRIARRHGLGVIEDAAQSLGSTLGGRHTGTFGDLGCYSLYPAKVMTSGEGGFIVTGKKSLHDRLLMIRNHGMVRGYDTRMLGLNLRMPEISAAIAGVQIKKLAKFLAARRRNALLLSELLSDTGIKIPTERDGERVNWYLYTIEAAGRDRLARHLASAGFGAAAYYGTPVHKTPYYTARTRLPVTDRAAARVLSLPVHPGVTIPDIREMAGIIRRIAR